MGREERVYTAKFYRELESTRESAAQILPIVLELVKPASVVDVGCGIGDWLAVAAELGVHDFLGIDGGWVKQTQLVIPKEKFTEHDLATPLNLDRRFDLALSLEVVEHLPAAASRILVESLCRSADVILFSAAIPGQGGRHHVNEQWPDYWADLFQEYGYGCYDCLRPRIWNDPRIAWYYAQNCLIFARPPRPGLGSPARPLRLVHPILWSTQIAHLKSPGKLLERLPKAIIARLRERPRPH
jgi:SAM-dependent methyltransferase